MCVDKTPDSLADFTALAEESRQIGPDWAIVFAAALPGRPDEAPAAEELDELDEQELHP